MSLTHKQRELLEYIDGYIKQSHGVAPSFDEMTEALQLQSKSGVHRMITALEERGFIKRHPGRARAIDVIRRPGDPAPSSAGDALTDRYRAALAKIASGAHNFTDSTYGPETPQQIARQALGWAT